MPTADDQGVVNRFHILEHTSKRYNEHMQRSAPVKTNLDFDAFLDMEMRSQERHEFVDGNLFVMPGGSERHNMIAGHLIAQAFLKALQKGYRLLHNDVLVRTPSGIGYYPDVFLVSDPSDNEARVKRAPCLIIEVLSDSTEAIDRGEKMRNYRTIPSLETYVLLEQDAPRAEVFSKQPDGSWRHDVLEADGTLRLPQLDLEIALESLYANLPPMSL
jgi:Uma2 family endonuclease